MQFPKLADTVVPFGDDEIVTNPIAEFNEAMANKTDETMYV